ncbi:hypothetical protein Q4595_16170 [Wenyingzhuangia sp. 1_MG-2023]|nr:hypothetical protein [Wenyingzhuangia sp. 1_MG-2023]
MEYIVLAFTFFSILPFAFLFTYLLKHYGFRQKYVNTKPIKSLIIILLVSIIPSIYLSYRTVFPSDSSLIENFEKSLKIEFPNSAQIISKKSNSGFNDSYLYFKFIINDKNELNKFEKIISKGNLKDCPNCYSSFYKYRKFYKLHKNNSEYNLIFMKDDNEIIYEHIKH